MLRFTLTFIAIAFLSSCSVVKRPSSEELAQLSAVPPEIQSKVDVLVPKAVAWLRETVEAYKGKGRPLSAAEAEFAQSLGIKKIEQIQIVVAATFPKSNDMILNQAMRQFGMGALFEGGRTMDHTIFVKPRYAKDSRVITHELNHVAQFERFGLEEMVKRYITEMMIFGYSRAPLELEAYDKQVELPSTD
jgi:hypothetical protein